MGLGHAIHAAQYRASARAIVASASRSSIAPRPDASSFDVCRCSWREDGSWPVDLTGGFSSFHPGACNFLFCDGSVRLLKNSINSSVYRLLGNRADGEMISADQY